MASRFIDRFATAGARRVGSRRIGGVSGPKVQRKLAQSIAVPQEPLTTAPPMTAVFGFRSWASQTSWHQSAAGRQWSSVQETIAPLAAAVAAALNANTDAPRITRCRTVE